MLRINGMDEFYFIRNFHDTRCKQDRVLSIIREQLHRDPREGEVFIVMSKDHRKVRMFEYDHRSSTLHEKRFQPGYRFMKIEYAGEETIYRIQWRDVVALLESPVIKSLKIN